MPVALAQAPQVPVPAERPLAPVPAARLLALVPGPELAQVLAPEEASEQASALVLEPEPGLRPSAARVRRGGLGLVPIHEIGSNHESKDDASQDDSEERPTAGLVVVCHIIVLLLRVVGPDEAEPIELSTLGRG